MIFKIINFIKIWLTGSLVFYSFCYFIVFDGKAITKAIPEESSLNTLEGCLRFEQQMKKAMTPHWKHFEDARVESMIAASTNISCENQEGE